MYAYFARRQTGIASINDEENGIGGWLKQGHNNDSTDVGVLVFHVTGTWVPFDVEYKGQLNEKYKFYRWSVFTMQYNASYHAHFHKTLYKE